MAREIDGLIQTDYTNRILLREAQLRRVEEKLTQAIEEARRGAVSLEELKEMLTELYQEV